MLDNTPDTLTLKELEELLANWKNFRIEACKRRQTRRS